MARTPAASDMVVDVPGVGEFRFGRRTFGDKFLIQRERDTWLRKYGIDPDEVVTDKDPRYEAAVSAMAMASYSVLMVSCPAGWESLDGLDLVGCPEFEDHIWTVMGAWRAKQDSFRRPADQAGQATGAGAGGDVSVLVSPEVQPSSE